MLVSRARVHQHRQRDQCDAFSMRPFSASCAACWTDWVRSGECDEIQMRYFRILLPTTPTNSNMQIRFEWNSHTRAPFRIMWNCKSLFAQPNSTELFIGSDVHWLLCRPTNAHGVNFMATERIAVRPIHTAHTFAFAECQRPQWSSGMHKNFCGIHPLPVCVCVATAGAREFSDAVNAKRIHRSERLNGVK